MAERRVLLRIVSAAFQLAGLFLAFISVVWVLLPGWAFWPALVACVVVAVVTAIDGSKQVLAAAATWSAALAGALTLAAIIAALEVIGAPPDSGLDVGPVLIDCVAALCWFAAAVLALASRAEVARSG
jgi:hypothetical protein